MTFTFAVLLCLGLSLRPRSPVLAGVLPKPTIKAEPGSLVTRGMQVNISCMGTSDAQKYLLFIKKFKNVQHRQSSTIRGEKAVFSINSIGQYDGGQYYCFYVTTSGWSAQSDNLELVVTGIFENKPCLSVLPRCVVTPGENVTFKCFSQEEYDRFIVIKEGELKHSMIMESQKTSAGQFQALFFVGPMTSSSSGTFKCYGYYKANPHVWSEPSDHLEIQILGLSRKPVHIPNHILAPLETLIIHGCPDAGCDRLVLDNEGGNNLSQHCGLHSQTELSQTNYTLAPENSFCECQYRDYGIHMTPHLSGSAMNIKLSKDACKPKTASDTQDHTVENLIRMGLAGLVFIILGTLLFEHWRNQSWTYHEAGK